MKWSKVCHHLNIDPGRHLRSQPHTSSRVNFSFQLLSCLGVGVHRRKARVIEFLNRTASAEVSTQTTKRRGTVGQPPNRRHGQVTATNRRLQASPVRQGYYSSVFRQRDFPCTFCRCVPAARSIPASFLQLRISPV